MGMTRSSSKPSNRRAAAWRRSASSTRSAICCSAAAPRSRRCAIRRASSTGDVSSPDGVEDQRRQEQPVRSAGASRTRLRPPGRSPRPAGCVRRARSAGPEPDRAGRGRCRRRSTAAASSGSARSSTPVVSRNRRARTSPSVSTPSRSWVELRFHRSGVSPCSPIQVRRCAPGRIPSVINRAAFERDLEPQLGGRLADEVDHAVVGLHPAVGRPPGRCAPVGPGGRPGSGRGASAGAAAS